MPAARESSSGVSGLVGVVEGCSSGCDGEIEGCSGGARGQIDSCAMRSSSPRHSRGGNRRKGGWIRIASG